MKWNKFTLKTRSEVEDIVISTLADVGIEGVEIQDKQPLTDIENTVADGKCHLRHFAIFDLS